MTSIELYARLTLLDEYKKYLVQERLGHHKAAARHLRKAAEAETALRLAGMDAVAEKIKTNAEKAVVNK